MTKQEMRNLTYDGLAKCLSDKGFRLRKSEEGFVKSIAGGKQTVGLPLYDYHPEFEFSVTICTRLDAVEEIFHLFSGSPPKYHPLTYTAMTLLDYFVRDSRFHVRTEHDVASALVRLAPIIRDKILPFLDANSDVPSLNKAINQDAKPIDNSYHPSRAMHGIILAHLAADPHFDQLATRYAGEMLTLSQADQAKFQMLVDYLRTQQSK